MMQETKRSEKTPETGSHVMVRLGTMLYAMRISDFNEVWDNKEIPSVAELENINNWTRC
ncbi:MULTISPECIES: hypothetical protein [unclassified Providencia]|uniref:hypothetical protein n=2 Tax=Providencia TaxID=586 RepID=UPI001445B59B|nr:hypothetical protein [Providencia sp. PROV206]MCK9788009.1 hypothetical protein [Providencia rettgeri]MDX7424295.1 hypothetical protein [Providencia sp. CIM-Carb-044]